MPKMDSSYWQRKRKASRARHFTLEIPTAVIALASAQEALLKRGTQQGQLITVRSALVMSPGGLQNWHNSLRFHSCKSAEVARPSRRGELQDRNARRWKNVHQSVS